jgi:hypothetical protein
MKYFVYKEKPKTNEKIVETRVKKRYDKNIKLHTIKAKQLSDIAPPPKPGEHYMIITEKQFNAFAMIVNLIENNTIDEMHLAVYRINEPTVTAIIEFIESGKIKKGTFVISSFFNQTKKPEQWAIKLRKFCEGNDSFKHIYTHNHAKVLAAKVADDYYVFEGSGNMSDNARIEQYRYENSKESFEFHKDWMTNASAKG